MPFTVLGAVALSVPALAQSAANGTAGSGAQLSVYPACTTQPTKDDSEVAHGAYIAGKRAFDENDYPTAIQYFKDAFRRDCTKYELLNIISRSYELRGDKPEAINALETYLKRAPASDPGTEAIQKRLTNLKAQAAADASTKGTTSATVTPPATATTTTATPTAPSATSNAETSPPREHTVGPWILVGVGAAAVVTGIVVLAVGEKTVSSASADHCGPGGASSCADPAGASSQQTQGNTLAAIGGVVGGVGVVAVVGGLVWHFIEPTSPAPQGGSHIGVRPDARPGYAGLSIGGTF